MDTLTIETLKKIINKIPDDFTVECQNNTTTYPLGDEITIDVSGKKLILK